MSRNLGSPMIAAIAGNVFYPALLLDIAFKTQTSHAWSGVGPLAWNGNSYLGVGSLGKVSAIRESTEIASEGMSIGLSGLDPAWLGECLTDIQIGAPATLWIASLDAGGNVVSAYAQFGGIVSSPSFDIGSEDLAITLSLENRLAYLQRGQQQRYTAAYQRIAYPDDIGFNWVETLNDIALRWGQ